MKSEIEQLGPCKVKIKVEIPPDEIQGKIEEKYKEVGSSVTIPGFRKGKVPRKILEKRFGKTVEEDAKLDLIQGAYQQTVDDKKLAAVGDPDIDPATITMDAEKPMQFELTVETKPEVKPKEYTGIEAKKKKVTVTDEELSRGLERLAESRGEWVPAEKAVENDMLVADLSLKEGDKELLAEPNTQVIVAKDLEVLHAPAPQVYKALLGAKAGDTKEADVTVPDTHKDETLRGKKVAFKAVVKEVKHLKKPEIGDAWAKEMDYENLDKLKEDIKKRIAEQKEHEARHSLEQEIVDAILAKHDIPLPETLLSKYSEKAEERLMMSLQLKGIPEEEVQKEIEKHREGSKGEMEKLLKTHFLLEAIAQKERIFVTEDEIDQRIEGLAGRYGRMPGEVREMMEQRGQMTELRSSLREEKIRKFLREKAKITEAAE